MMTVFKISDTCQSDRVLQLNKKIRRGPKLEGCAFANFGNSSGTEGEPSQKRDKNGGGKKSMLPRPGIEPGTCQ